MELGGAQDATPLAWGDPSTRPCCVPNCVLCADRCTKQAYRVSCDLHDELLTPMGAGGAGEVARLWGRECVVPSLLMTCQLYAR